MSLLRSSTVRFAAVGVLNTLLDLGLFVLLEPHLGVVLANLVSTSAGMTLSFVANGLVTFGAGRLTLRHAGLFVATTGTTLWVVSPLVIGALGAAGVGVAAAKVVAIATCLGVNYASYRFVVWPRVSAPAPQP